MGSFGLPEIILILVIVLLLFGPGRIGKVAGEIGSGIHSFRKNLEGDDAKEAGLKVEEPKDSTAK